MCKDCPLCAQGESTRNCNDVVVSVADVEQSSTMQDHAWVGVNISVFLSSLRIVWP